MSQGYCEDQCDKCPDAGPLYRVGSYNLCFGCREEVRYDNMEANEETRGIVSDLRVGLVATQDREQDLLVEINDLRLGISDLFEHEGALDNDSLLELIKEEIEFADETDETLTSVAMYVDSRSLSVEGIIGAISSQRAYLFALGVMCGITAILALQLVLL
jgi:hypothetical protein